jgi:DNA-binding transcriptional regulator GbsR (MarR family)
MAMTPEQRELIEEFGLLQEQMGATRMTGRVSGWLLLCSPPVQSLTEIAEGLGVSKAAVSGAARLLLQNRIVERISEPGQRGDFYRALPADPDGIIPLDHVRTLHRLIERALLSVADRDQSQPNYALMRDLLDFTTFVEVQLPELVQRWKAHKAGRTAAGTATRVTPPHPTRSTGGTT